MESLNDIYSTERTRSSYKGKESRTAFQRDYDRIIFSSAFQRLQNKTQVFPLPGSTFVHNRLTHSLEVSSVGRSLAYEIGQFINTNYNDVLTTESLYFYQHGLQHVISAACLCHDIGNPAFGHSGEDAIALFFKKNETDLKPYFTEIEWLDLTNFEGNANAIRILTQHQAGKQAGGLDLTFSTLSAIAKYPCDSKGKDTRKNPELHRKKFGFMQSEKDIFLKMATTCHFIQESTKPIIFKRHPFVWITEAADDICYNIIDFEDAHRLGIITTDELEPLFIDIVTSLSTRSSQWKDKLGEIKDPNERVSFLRAMSIGSMIQASYNLYCENFLEILNGTHRTGIVDMLIEENPALRKIKNISVDKIYNNKYVLQIENAGYNVLYALLEHFLFPSIKQNLDSSDKMALKLMPAQFKYPDGTTYQKALGVIDYISGMTDNYATDLYRKIKGIDIGMIF